MKNAQTTTYQFQTIGGRKINVKATSWAEAEVKACQWRDRVCPDCVLAYNFIVS